MAKRRKKTGASKPAKTTSVTNLFERAAGWPLYEALVSQRWDDPARLTSVLVARRSRNTGQLAVAIFLVDLACLGVKNVLLAVFDSEQDYTARLRERYLAEEPMAPTDLGPAAKIVAVGLVYADNLGFAPHPDFFLAEHLLADADFAACPTSIPTGGPEGKPLFVAGPDDDAPAVIAHLTRRLGKDGFHFIAPLAAEDTERLGFEDARRVEQLP